MANTTKSKTDAVDERQIRLLVKALRSKGYEVRREKLARGDSFRVKSGNCVFSGKDLIFVDSRLPGKQQITVLVDHILELGVSLSEEELSLLAPSTRSLLSLPKELHPIENSAA